MYIWLTSLTYLIFALSEEGLIIVELDIETVPKKMSIGLKMCYY